VAVCLNMLPIRGSCFTGSSRTQGQGGRAYQETSKTKPRLTDYPLNKTSLGSSRRRSKVTALGFQKPVRPSVLQASASQAACLLGRISLSTSIDTP